MPDIVVYVVIPKPRGGIVVDFFHRGAKVKYRATIKHCFRFMRLSKTETIADNQKAA